MDESALRNRLDVIERRQLLILSLILVAYAVGGSWILVEEIDAVTVWSAGVGLTVLAVVASMVGMYRRRQTRQ